jgi:hypothetical protein
VLRAIENFRRLYAKVEEHLLTNGTYYRRNLGEYNQGRDCLGFMSEIGRGRDDAEVLRRTEEIFNRVRTHAFQLLDRDPGPKTVPLARFMTRQPLV